MARSRYTSVKSAILRTLRLNNESRYTELLHETELDSADFKFYLRRIIDEGYVTKISSGKYTLTPEGRDYVGTVDLNTGDSINQPRLNVFIVAKRETKETAGTEFLVQQRKRTPYFGFWGVHGGPVHKGEAAEETARRILAANTGYTASFEVVGFFRERDYSDEGDLLEDKIFIVVLAKNIHGELTEEWDKGQSSWLTLDKLSEHEKVFSSCLRVLKLDPFSGNYFYFDAENTYTHNEY